MTTVMPCSAPAVSTLTGTPVSFTVTCSDASDLEIYPSVDGPWWTIAQHGDLDINSLKDGAAAFRYYPDAGFTGADGFDVLGYNRYHEAGELAVGITVKAPTGGGDPSQPPPQPSTPSSPGTPSTPGPTPAQVKAAIEAYLGQAVTPKVVAAVLKAIKGGMTGPVTIKVGPFGQDVVLDLQLVLTPKGKASAAAGKTARKVVVGKARLALPKTRSGKLKVTLTKQGTALLRKQGRLKLTMTLTVTNAATGATSKKTRTIRLKAKKKTATRH